MPFYEYECSACKFYIETLQKISDPPLTRCTSCGKETLARLISAPVFRLKGAGWYETDFKSDKEDKRNLAEDKEPADKTAAADSADGDTKTKVRASKALKKTAGKQSGNKARGKAVVKAKTKSKAAAKPAGKGPRKVGRNAAGKGVVATRAPAKKAAKKAARKQVKRSATKRAKKPVNKVAKKK